MTTSTTQTTTEATAIYNTGKVRKFLERRDVKLMTVMMDTGINVGRLAEIVNGNYPASDAEKETLGAWALGREEFEK